MSHLKKRETAVQNIAYMGIMAAVNIAFVLITTYVAPALFFTIVFALPLSSAIVTIYCKKRYYPIYAFVTAAICILTTFWDPGNTIFYVIPSLISGFLFGLCMEKGVSSLWSIAGCTAVQILFSYLAIYLVRWVLSTDMIAAFVSVFRLGDFPYKDYLVFPFIFVVSLIQEALCYMILKDEVGKFMVEKPEGNHGLPAVFAISFVCVAGIVVFAFFFPVISYILYFILLYFSMYLLVLLLAQKKGTIYAFLGISLLLTVVLFAVLYSVIPDPLQLLVTAAFFALVDVIALIRNKHLFKGKSEDTIETESV